MQEQMTKQDAIEYLLYLKHDVQAKSPMDIALDTAIEVLKQPTIEPEVRHGRWIPHKITASSKCSECRRVFADETLFCPNCGARMDADHIADDSKKVGGADDGQIWGCNHGTSTKIRRMGEKERRADSF